MDAIRDVKYLPQRKGFWQLTKTTFRTGLVHVVEHMLWNVERMIHENVRKLLHFGKTGVKLPNRQIPDVNITYRAV